MSKRRSEKRRRGRSKGEEGKEDATRERWVQRKLEARAFFWFFFASPGFHKFSVSEWVGPGSAAGGSGRNK